jgi:NitT/TauT family transport system permease protein
VGQGFLVALAIGFPLGLLTGRFNAMKQVFDPLFNMVRTIPGISWLPLAMVWFGIGSKPTVFLIAVGAFFPIYLNTAIGVKQIPDGLIQAARMLGARGRDLFFRTIIPAAAASILTGMRLGLGFAWAYLVVGEMTGVSQGLGATMMGARLVGNTSMIIVCMLCIAFWGVVTDRLLVYVIRKLHPSKEIMSHE